MRSTASSRAPAKKWSEADRGTPHRAWRQIVLQWNPLAEFPLRLRQPSPLLSPRDHSVDRLTCAAHRGFPDRRGFARHGAAGKGRRYRADDHVHGGVDAPGADGTQSGRPPAGDRLVGARDGVPRSHAQDRRHHLLVAGGLRPHGRLDRRVHAGRWRARRSRDGASRGPRRALRCRLHGLGTAGVARQLRPRGYIHRRAVRAASVLGAEPRQRLDDHGRIVRDLPDRRGRHDGVRPAVAQSHACASAPARPPPSSCGRSPFWSLTQAPRLPRPPRPSSSAP